MNNHYSMLKKAVFSLSIAGVLLILSFTATFAQANTETILLENNLVHFEFEKNSTDIRLKTIKNKSLNREFQMSNDPLWKLETYNPLSESAIDSVAPSNATISYTLSTLSTSKQLILEWQNAEIIPSETVSVSITIDLPNNSAIADWKISVENDLTRLYLVDASISFGVVDTPGEDDFVAIPYRGTQEIKNPATNIIGAQHLRTLRYPVQGVIQLVPYYTESKNGLYVATYDSQEYLKQFIFEGDNSRFLYTLEHPTSDTFNAGKNFTLPYPLKIGVYEGDWYEASKMYRSWATTQPWASRGKIISRTDVPQWVKDLKLLHISVDAPTNVATQVSAYTQIRQFYGLDDMFIWWQAWTQDPLFRVPTNPGFVQTVQQLKNQDIFSFPYTQWHSYRTGAAPLSPLGEDSFVKKINGERLQLGNDAIFFDISTPYFQDSLVNSANAQTNLGMKGVYYDIPASFIDYSTSTSRTHPPGGGNYYSGQYRHNFQLIRDTMRNSDPEGGIIYPEVASENLIYGTDFVFTDFRTTPVTINQLANRYVPMYESVYHDYTLIFGSNDRVFYAGPFADFTTLDAVHAFGFNTGSAPSEREDCFTSTISQTVCNQLGPETLTINMPLMADHTLFVKNMIDARVLANKFHIYGELLRPLSNNSPEIIHTIIDSIIPGEVDKQVAMPEIFSSVWRANDGDIGIILTNYNPDPKSLTYTFRFSDYGVAGTKYLYEMGENGDTYLGTFSGTFARTENIGRKEVKVFRLSSTPPPDTTGPSVSFTAPSNNTSVSGTITLSATATDPSGVAGVQFKLNGNNLGTEDSIPPYEIDWDTTTVSDGPHTLSAQGRDTSNNLSVSGLVSINVNNGSTTTFPLLLGPPSNLSSVHTINNRVDLAWTDNSQDETGFRIERGVSQNAFLQLTTVGSNTTSYTDTSGAANTTYYYRVRAYKPGQNSGYSNIAAAHIAPIPISGPPPVTTPLFTINLYRGLTHPQVTTLQGTLSKDPSLYPEGIVSGFFGSLTERAVQRFQARYGVVSSGSPGTTGYGRVGPQTRAKLNEVYTGGTTPSPAPTPSPLPGLPPPSGSISSLSIALGSTGSNVTLWQDFLVKQNSGFHAQALQSVFEGGTPKGYFGTLTGNATEEWQAANGITNTFPAVGPQTRARLQELGY